MAAETVHFRISGDDMTRLARDAMIEDEPGRAWRLATCLNGEGKEAAALAILKGEKRLVGDESGMDLVDDHGGQAYRAQIAWVYAGRIKIRGRWFRPVARVIDFGINDLRNDHGIPVGTVRNRSGCPTGMTNRQWHYALSDEIAPETANDDVIFEPCGERPAWQVPPRDADAAVEEWLAAGRGLEARGHSIWYPSVSATAPPDVDGLDEDVAEIARSEHDARCAEHDALRAKRYADRIAELRARILDQAAGDMLTLTWKEDTWSSGEVRAPGGTAQVPRAPFMHWALADLRIFQHHLPPWDPVCPPGMKMGGDNPYHTDWVVGAGIPLDDCYGEVMSAALKLSGEIQDRLDRPAATVIVDGPHAWGPVIHGRPNTTVPAGSIVVLPNLSPKYVACTLDAAAIICEAGGATAHLAQVGRERSLPIVLVEGARAMFREGVTVTVDTASRTVRGSR